MIHRVIQQHELGPGRLVVVGDVHGCLVELFQLLDAVKFDYAKDNLILVGDMCNKGPRSQEVRTLVQLPLTAPHQSAALQSCKHCRALPH